MIGQRVFSSSPPPVPEGGAPLKMSFGEGSLGSPIASPAPNGQTPGSAASCLPVRQTGRRRGLVARSTHFNCMLTAKPELGSAPFQSAPSRMSHSPSIRSSGRPGPSHPGPIGKSATPQVRRPALRSRHPPADSNKPCGARGIGAIADPRMSAVLPMNFPAYAFAATESIGPATRASRLVCSF